MQKKKAAVGWRQSKDVGWGDILCGWDCGTLVHTFNSFYGLFNWPALCHGCTNQVTALYCICVCVLLKRDFLKKKKAASRSRYFSPFSGPHELAVALVGRVISWVRVLLTKKMLCSTVGPHNDAPNHSSCISPLLKHILKFYINMSLFQCIINKKY